MKIRLLKKSDIYEKLLNIVDANDNIIGVNSREEIHQNGWRHREIHVYFITPNKKIIFQHRAKDKDTFPDLLDATVGGHVEIGQSYAETAIKETEEETGVKINESDLRLINKIKKYSADKVTGKLNNALNSRYLYIYRGNINDLKIEAGKALGFETYTLDELMHLNTENQARFIPYILKFATTELAEFIKNLKL